MHFECKNTKNQEPGVDKTLYLKSSLAGQIEKIAAEDKSRFNNAAVSMSANCLKVDHGFFRSASLFPGAAENVFQIPGKSVKIGGATETLHDFLQTQHKIAGVAASAPVV